MTDNSATTRIDDERIAWLRLRLRLVALPLANPLGDARGLTCRQTRMSEIAILVAEIETRDGH